MNKTPLLSVLMITYNHEPYIAQAIESILAQKTNFPFEVVIGEDCSTDNTCEIAKSYQRKYSDEIILISSKENVGGLQNEKRVLQACQGKYIAFCEGDDFWHDPLKLQKQVEFLENHSDYGLVHSDVDHLFQGSGKMINNYNRDMGYKIPEGDIFDELIDPSKNHGHIIKTMSVVVRKDLLNNYYDPKVAIDQGWLLTDLAMWLDIAKHSKIHYIYESLATYRLLDESASRTQNPLKKLEFHNSVYEIRKYYMEKYECFRDLQDKLKINHYRTLLADAYIAQDVGLAKEAYQYLKEKKIKLSIKENLLYNGTKYLFIRRLIEVSWKLIMRLKIRTKV